MVGKGIAKPSATNLSGAMMLRYSGEQDREADDIERAVKQVLKEGFRTADIMPEGGKASGENKCSCSEMGSRIAERI